MPIYASSPVSYIYRLTAKNENACTQDVFVSCFAVTGIRCMKSHGSGKRGELKRSWHKGMIVSMITTSIMCIVPVYAEQIKLTAFDYPPYMNESLPGKGLFCELVSEAYQSVGYDVSFDFYPLNRSTQYVIEGKALGQLGTEWNFPEDARKNAVQSVPLFYYRVVGFYLNDRLSAISFKSLKDLQGYRLGVIRGSSDAAILLDHPELNLTVEAVSLMEQMFKKVDADRSDIGFTVELSGLTHIATHYPNEQDRWVMTQDAIQGILAQVVFSNKYKGSDKFMKALEEGIQRIRDNGTYLRVFKKYYGKRKVPDIVSDVNREIYVIPKE
jgi:polar amino acid transport system substrate-binding protein